MAAFLIGVKDAQIRTKHLAQVNERRFLTKATASHSPGGRSKRAVVPATAHLVTAVAGTNVARLFLLIFTLLFCFFIKPIVGDKTCRVTFKKIKKRHNEQKVKVNKTLQFVAMKRGVSINGSTRSDRCGLTQW